MQATRCNPSSPPLSLSELNDSINENSDTVGQIVHYIMKNEGTAVLVFQNNSLFIGFISNLLGRAGMCMDSAVDFLKSLAAPFT